MSVSKQNLEPVHHGMDLEEELYLHLRRWRLRTWVSGFLLIMVILTALGLFGGGPLSSTAVSGGGNALEYERFARFGKEVRMEFHIGAGGNTARIPLDYLKHFKLDRIVPEPQAQQVQASDVVFRFDSRDGLVARFYLVPRNAGFVRTSVTVNGTDLPVTQFVYP